MWRVLVIGILTVAPAWYVAARQTQSNAVAMAGAVIVSTLILGIATLILTTPVDAIRLSPTRSMIYITAGTAWLSAVQAACAWPMTWQEIAFSALLPLAAWAYTFMLGRVGKTPWWVAVLLWNPAVLGPIALSSRLLLVILNFTTVFLVLLNARKRPV